MICTPLLYAPGPEDAIVNKMDMLFCFHGPWTLMGQEQEIINSEIKSKLWSVLWRKWTSCYYRDHRGRPILDRKGLDEEQLFKQDLNDEELASGKWEADKRKDVNLRKQNYQRLWERKGKGGRSREKSKRNPKFEHG